MKNRKIINFSQVNSFFKKIKGKKVLVGGCFDIIHYGHIKFLEAAKKQGDILIIALESDEFIINKKKRKPFHTQKQRAFILSQLICVDYIILLPFFKKDGDYQNLVIKIKPNIIGVTESDPLFEKKKNQAKKISAELKIVVKKHLPFSSSFISENLKK